MNFYFGNKGHMKKLKQKVLNHFMLNGKKQTSESALLKTSKLIQKSNKQQHVGIVKLAIINTTPAFRVIQLTNKKKKKKDTLNKEIPAFVPDYSFRSSWALKHLIIASKKKSISNIFSHRLKHEILLNAEYKGEAVNFKNELQKQALQKKKFFKYYRW